MADHKHPDHPDAQAARHSAPPADDLSTAPTIFSAPPPPMRAGSMRHAAPLPPPRPGSEFIDVTAISNEPSSAGAASVGGSSTFGGAANTDGVEQIGPYKILQLLGEGGFGYVYLGQQTHPIKRKVAVKVLKPGMDSKQVLARFEGERQALSLMDHPNIARVLDAGTTPEGRPYFVMELVKGLQINEFCDTSNLSTPERLNLFISVCNALQHAHQKGIIHRDIKPSNVLVTLQDDKPVVKVIDFGIAKAINQDIISDEAVFTAIRQVIGTPAYMAPEQAGQGGADVDTRSDIYSLGVLLYELVCGSLPIETTQLQGMGMDDFRKIILETDPPLPSSRITKARKSTISATPGSGDRTGATSVADAIARHRRTDPSSLRKVLAGELDWIVMRCLEKDRNRRYQSAAALGEDISRYLRGDAIEARPATTAYRLLKFTRRNRLAIGASGGIVMAMLLTLVALAYGLHQAQLERDKTAERETRTRARMLLSSMNAVRDYTSEKVRPTLLDEKGGYDHFRPEMVPAFSARQVFEKFKGEEFSGFIYKEASPNPTNSANLADEFELGLVTEFQKNRGDLETDGIRTINKKEHFYIARPLSVTKTSCLDCHSTPEKAPPRQLELYGRGGFGWEVGQVVSAQIVYVPITEAFRAQRDGQRTLYISLASIFVIGGIGAAIMLRRL